MITGRLSHSDVVCANDSRCHCLFELWKGPQFVAGQPVRGSEVIAACPTIDAHNAARRLLGQPS